MPDFFNQLFSGKFMKMSENALVEKKEIRKLNGSCPFLTSGFVLCGFWIIQLTDRQNYTKAVQDVSALCLRAVEPHWPGCVRIWAVRMFSLFSTRPCRCLRSWRTTPSSLCPTARRPKWTEASRAAPCSSTRRAATEPAHRGRGGGSTQHYTKLMS